MYYGSNFGSTLIFIWMQKLVEYKNNFIEYSTINYVYMAVCMYMHVCNKIINSAVKYSLLTINHTFSSIRAASELSSGMGVGLSKGLIASCLFFSLFSMSFFS